MRNLVKLSAASILVAGSAQAASFDPPDLNFERQLYQNYRALKSSTEIPRNITQNYRLQNGETLWSLSEMLYGDGNYWPQVWAHSKATTQPHLVKPGHYLQFRVGSEEEAPAFRFSEEDDSRGLELAASNGSNPIVEIPPPEVPPRPVLKIPGSFPPWQAVFQPEPVRTVDDRALGKTFGRVIDRIWLTAYVQETPLESLGEFLENDGESGLPLANQYVYVKMKKGMGRLGQKLLVVKDQGRIKETNDLWDSRKEPAYLVQIFAELEVTEEVAADFKKRRDRDGYSTYRALVTRSTGLSFVDCTVIAGQMEMINLDSNGTHGTAVGQIIGSEKHTASAMAGPGEIVFLNRGSSHGVEPGQILDVYINRISRHYKTPVPHSPAPSGTVRVVKVSNRLATAVILKARDSVMQGDLVREVSANIRESERREIYRDERGEGGEIDELDSAESELELDATIDDLESEIENSESY